MKKLSITICWTLLLIIAVMPTIFAQNTKLTDNTYYKNVVKYYDQAEAFLEQGNKTDAQKRLKYADMFAQKLIKAGHEADIQDYLDKILKMKTQLAPNASTVNKERQTATHTLSSGSVMSTSEWRDAVSEMSKLESQLRNLFNFLPAYAQLNENYLQPIATIKAGGISERIEELKLQPEASKSFHKTYLRDLDRTSKAINDLSATLAASGFSSNMESTFKYIEEGAKGQSAFVIKNTNAYLDQLSSLLGEDKLLLQMRNKLKIATATLEANQEAVAKANKAKTEDRSMPVRGLRDANLEKEFKSLARRSVPAQFKITDVIITSSRWGVNKDALGRPMNRAMIAYMLEKDSSGNCYVQYFAFSQPANGNTYGRTQIDLDWSSKTRRAVDCP